MSAGVLRPRADGASALCRPSRRSIRHVTSMATPRGKPRAEPRRAGPARVRLRVARHIVQPRRGPVNDFPPRSDRGFLATETAHSHPVADEKLYVGRVLEVDRFADPSARGLRRQSVMNLPIQLSTSTAHARNDISGDAPAVIEPASDPDVDGGHCWQLAKVGDIWTDMKAAADRELRAVGGRLSQQGRLRHADEQARADQAAGASPSTTSTGGEPSSSASISASSHETRRASWCRGGHWSTRVAASRPKRGRGREGGEQESESGTVGHCWFLLASECAKGGRTGSRGRQAVDQGQRGAVVTERRPSKKKRALVDVEPRRRRDRRSRLRERVPGAPREDLRCAGSRTRAAGGSAHGRARGGHRRRGARRRSRGRELGERRGGRAVGPTDGRPDSRGRRAGRPLGVSDELGGRGRLSGPLFAARSWVG